MLRHVLIPLFPIHRLCTDLTTLITERCEIERAYAKNLKSWSKKWGDLIEKGIERINLHSTFHHIMLPHCHS